MSDKRALLGQRIRAARKERHLSQRELAKRSGVSFTTIQRIETENRKTTINNLAAVLRALNSVEGLDAESFFEGLDYEEVKEILDEAKAQDKKAREKLASDYVWLQEEITLLVKKIQHVPLLETLLDVTHAFYTEDLFVRGELIGRSKTTDELLAVDKHPNALDIVTDSFRKEASNATDEE